MTGRSDAAVLAPALAFVTLFTLLPVAVLFATALAGAGGVGAAGAILSNPLNREAVTNSLVQGGLSAVLAVALGYPAGVFFGRYRWRGRALVRSFLLVPFLLPSLVVIFGILDLFGPSGILSSVVPGLAVLGNGLPAIIAVNLVFNVPRRPLHGDRLGERVGRSRGNGGDLGGFAMACLPRRMGPTDVGRSGRRGLAYVPLLGPLVRASPGPVRFPVLHDRGADLLSRVLPRAERGRSPRPGDGALLPLYRPSSISSCSGGSGRSRGRRVTTRPISWRSPLSIALAAESLVVLAAVLAVVSAVLYRSVAPVGGGTAGAAWVGLFSSTTTARVGVSVYSMVTNTLLFATAATVIAILFGIVLGYAVVGRPSRTRALGVLLFVPLLVSPVVLALALATFWRPLLGGATNVWFLVIVSQAILALPFALQSIEIPLSGLTARAREAAQSLGAAPWSAFLDADLPRVRDGLATAGLFAFALGLGEFTATNFLVTAQFTTLPVALYRLESARLFAVSDAAAGLLLLLSLAVFAVLTVGGRRVEL